MPKEIPWFKFYIGEYMNGDITACSFDAQGVFINLCCYYWNKQGSMSLAFAKQRFKQNEAEVNELLAMDILKVDNDESIYIDFLDEQLKEREMLHVKRVKAGSKGGKANAKQVLSKRVAIEKENKKENKKENIYRKFKHLSLSETEFESLKKKGLTKQQIDSYCDAIENYAKNKNYNSLNLTIQSWWRRDKKSSPSEFDNGIGGM